MVGHVTVAVTQQIDLEDLADREAHLRDRDGAAGICQGASAGAAGHAGGDAAEVACGAAWSAHATHRHAVPAKAGTITTDARLLSASRPPSCQDNNRCGVCGHPLSQGRRKQFSDSIFKQPQIHLRDLATRCARGSARILRPSKTEGAGNAGCLLHPRSRVQNGLEYAHEHTGTAGALRHSLRNGFTAYAGSPRRRIRLASVADGLRLIENPVGFKQPPPA